jgi:hypothetical protein
MKRTKLSLLVNYSLLPVIAARRSRFRRAAIAEQPYVHGQHYNREERAKIFPAHRIFTFTDPVQIHRSIRQALAESKAELRELLLKRWIAACTQRWKWAINLDRDVNLPLPFRALCIASLQPRAKARRAGEG